jgi:hypothetical protein
MRGMQLLTYHDVTPLFLPASCCGFVAFNWSPVCVQLAGLPFASARTIRGNQGLSHKRGAFLTASTAMAVLTNSHLCCKAIDVGCPRRSCCLSMSLTHLVARAGWRYQKVVACCTFGPPTRQALCTVPSHLLAAFCVPSRFGPCVCIPACLQQPQSRFDVGDASLACRRVTGEGTPLDPRAHWNFCVLGGMALD